MIRKSFLLLSFLALSTAQAQTGFALKSGDRVVLYGDSITDNSAYSKFVELFVRLRYPSLDVKFYNAGVGGDRVTGGWMGPVDDRLTRDLFSRKPTIITVMLGMNDGGYQPSKDEITKTYQDGYRHILDRFKKEAPAARVFLIKPSPFDDVTRAPGWEGGYNGVMKSFGSFVEGIGKSNGYGIVDFNAPVVSVLEKAKASNESVAAKIVPDRVHPGAAGHLVMAQQMMMAWGISPFVSNATIDTRLGQITGIQTTVSDYAKTDKITWTQRDEGLPFPMDRKDPVVALTLQSGDFDQKVNQQLLTVKGLDKASYALTIDEKPVGVFSADDLENGVNLAQYETPMLAQARQVWSMVAQRTDVAYSAWRQVEFTLGWLSSSKKTAALKAASELSDELAKRAREAAKPVKHRFRLVRAID